MRFQLAFSLALALPLCVSSPAAARVTVIDAGQFIPQGSLTAGCTIGGAACTATIMPFSFNFGNGITNQAYIYDRGIISFGQALPSSIGPSTDFTTLGIPVIAPLYVPGASGVAGPYQVSSQSIAVGSFSFPTTDPLLGSNVFLVNFLDPSTIDTANSISGLVSVIISASSNEIRFEYIHGMVNNALGVSAFPNTTGTQLGYVVAGNSLLQQPPNIAGINAFDITLNGTAVPEPGTWLMMLLGFAAMGLAVRRKKRTAALTVSG